MGTNASKIKVWCEPMVPVGALNQAPERGSKLKLDKSRSWRKVLEPPELVVKLSTWRMANELRHNHVGGSVRSYR